MTDRLRTIAPDLLQELSDASSVTQRMVASAIVQHVLRVAGVDGHEIDDALNALSQEDFGEGRHFSALRSLVESLDERAFDICDLLEEGEASEVEYLVAFRSARAANALEAALNVDPLAAAADSLYESLHSVEDQESVRDIAAGVFRAQRAAGS